MTFNAMLEGTRSLRIVLGAICIALALGGSASAWTWKTLHGFCAWTNCNDGVWPMSGLLMDRSGNLYGTTNFGGKYNEGVVFKYDPSIPKFSAIHSFNDIVNCSQYNENSCISDLIVDTGGALYGTTDSGGANHEGVIFKLKYNGTKWAYSVLHAFGACGSGGGFPLAGLTYAGQSAGAPWDGSSPLFGTNSCGGAYGNGVAYELTYSGSSWNETVIHDFGSGRYPNALVMDAAGNLFGTTELGGKYGGGLMFKLAAGTWTQTVLKNFCAQANCTDGSGPLGRLLVDASGNVFGTTEYGGSSNVTDCVSQSICGVVFERPASGGYQVIYDFCSLASCSDGDAPAAGLIMDPSGDLVGTTVIGGAHGDGEIFELVNRNGTWSETTIHSFCSKANCPDGSTPAGPVIMDGSGNIFATALYGGKHDDGTLLRLTP